MGCVKATREYFWRYHARCEGGEHMGLSLNKLSMQSEVKGQARSCRDARGKSRDARGKSRDEVA